MHNPFENPAFAYVGIIGVFIALLAIQFLYSKLQQHDARCRRPGTPTPKRLQNLRLK